MASISPVMTLGRSALSTRGVLFVRGYLGAALLVVAGGSTVLRATAFTWER